MAFRGDEHWYGDGWPYLKRELIQLCVNESMNFTNTVAAAGSEAELLAPVSTMFERVIRRSMKFVEKNPKTDLWQHAVALVIGEAEFAKAAFRDQRALSGEKHDIDPVQALRWLLARHFEDIRRALLPGSPNKRKVWEKIRRISQDVLNEKLARPTPQNVSLPQLRCSMEHMEEVLQVIRTRYPDDHNLPRTISTILDYFQTYCEDLFRVDIEYLQSKLGSQPVAVSQNEVYILMQTTGTDIEVMQCFETLSDDHATAFALKAKAPELQSGDITFLSLEHFRRARSLNRRELARLVEEARQLLAECVRRAAERGLP